MISTVTDFDTVAPCELHAIVNVLWPLMVTAVEPEVADDESPGPVVEQESGEPLVDQLMTEESPLLTVVGFAEIFTATFTTVTVADDCAWCPATEQSTLYEVVEEGFTCTDPDVAFPVEKFVPVHVLAPVEDQVSVEGPCPVTYEDGVAVRSEVGPGVTLAVFEQLGDTCDPPEVTVTDALFVPPLPYDAGILCAVP